MQKPVMQDCQIEDHNIELQQYLEMNYNSILLLLVTCLLFSLTLTQDKLGAPQVKNSNVYPSTKPNKQFSLESELNKIANILSSGNLSMLAATLATVTNNNEINCKDKASYVTKATELLKKRMSSNQQQLKYLQSQPQIPKSSKNTDELKNMLTNLKNTLLTKNYDSDLKAQETEKKQILQNLNKYTAIGDDLLNKLREFRKKNNIETNTINQQKALLKLDSEIQALDKLITETTRKRSELHKNLTDLKVNLLNEEIKAREAISLQKLQADFRQYSELALQANIKAKNLQQQLNRLSFQLKNKQLTRTIVDDQIDKATKTLQQKKGSSGEQAMQLIKSANNVLTQNMKNVQSRITIMNSDCLI